MKPDTIAFVVPRYGDEVVGGAEVHVRNLVEELHRRGWKVEILTTCALDSHRWINYFPAGTEYIRGIKVRRFPVEGRKYTRRIFKLEKRILAEDFPSLRKQELWIRSVVICPELYRYLEENRDKYRAFIFIPYLFGTTYVGSQLVPDRALIIPCLHDEPYAHMMVFRKMMRSVRGILFNTVPEMELGKRLYGDDLRCWIVSLGFEDFLSQGDRFREKYGLQGDFMLYSGRREPGKNTPLLIRYFCNYIVKTGSNLKLVLTGSGPVDFPHRFRGHVIDLGYVSERDKLDAYAAASLICQPSVNESLSILIMEGWLARTPCLVHGDCAVTRYHVEESGGGLWFRNYPQFHEALTLILSQREMARVMGEAGRRYVLENYNWDRIIENFTRAFEESGL